MSRIVVISITQKPGLTLPVNVIEMLVHGEEQGPYHQPNPGHGNLVVPPGALLKYYQSVTAQYFMSRSFRVAANEPFICPQIVQ